MTPGSGYTALASSSVTGGQANNNVTIIPEYQAVHSKAVYSATGTITSGTQKWAAAIVTYKFKVPSATSTVRADPENTSAAQVRFIVNFSDSVIGADRT